MRIKVIYFQICILMILTYTLVAVSQVDKPQESVTEKNENKQIQSTDLENVNVANKSAQLQIARQYCVDELKKYKSNFDEKTLAMVCAKTEVFDSCSSADNVPIFHYDKIGTGGSDSKKILVFSLIHGDEVGAGSVGRFWMERLDTLENPRNSWRVVPVLNPDGVKLGTRTNKNRIDLNRNFPTQDWELNAVKYWKSQSGANPRRFPGDKAASEKETQCAINHIMDFKPDFIISIHTPLSVLDFDGPKVKPPKFNYLPWRSLGHFPGSLGRYMWFERQTPVLTMEMKASLPGNFQTLEDLQDIIGTLVKLEIQKGKP